MSKILIVGNVTKDVYLRLDNRQNNFETDQNDIKWLDLAFDGSTHKYYNRVSIYGGASISLEVFKRFDIEPPEYLPDLNPKTEYYMSESY